MGGLQNDHGQKDLKRVKALVDGLCVLLPAVVLFRKAHDARASFFAELAELAKMQAWCRITTLELENVFSSTTFIVFIAAT
jgi:hypothetical protein